MLPTTMRFGGNYISLLLLVLLRGGYRRAERTEEIIRKRIECDGKEVHNRGIYGIILCTMCIIFSGALEGAKGGKWKDSMAKTAPNRSKRLWEDGDESDLGYFNWHKFTTRTELGGRVQVAERETWNV